MRSSKYFHQPTKWLGGDGEQACDVGHEADLVGDVTDFVSDLCGELVG
jgi:hypothetical protein